MSIKLNVSEDDFTLVFSMADEDIQEDMKICHEKLLVNPNHFQALFYLSRFNYKLKNYAETVRLCDKIINEVEDKLYFVWDQKGHAEISLGEYRKAFESFAHSASYSNNEKGSWSSAIIAVYLGEGKNIALAVLDNLIEDKDLKDDYSLVRGCIERDSGDSTEALMHFISGGLSVDPNAKDSEESKETYAREIARTLGTQ